MKTILGLDLGTNSIGWAVINSVIEEQVDRMWIELAGSRIIPMDAATLGDFEKGNSKSQTSEKTSYHLARKMRERHYLRRERLHVVLAVLGFLPEHYANQIDLEKRLGKFKKGTEPKLPWRKNECGQAEFLFQESFREMVTNFSTAQPDLVANGKKIPYDWTLYYLRKKALSQAVTKEELAWIILNFNQKRGYYQLRGEDEENKATRSEEFYALRVVRVEKTNQKKGKDDLYEVHFENGWYDRRPGNVPLDWEGKVKEFIVTTEYADDGSVKLNKYGEEKRSFRVPKEDDWTLVKKKTEAEITLSNKTVGWYIYDTLLENPRQKIKGKLIRAVERKFYKEELKAILEKQSYFHPELQDRNLYRKAIEALYTANVAYRESIAGRGFVYLFMDDLIFYQRPLKSKKSLIADCPYEAYRYIDKQTGEIKSVSLKGIAKSHPLFQEFRLWHFISGLRIYQRERTVEGKLLLDVDVTEEFLGSDEAYAALFEWLNDRAEIDQKGFFNYSPFGLKRKTVGQYRWNYVEDKQYPCNETRSSMLCRLAKIQLPSAFLTKKREEALWHLLYSVEDRHEIVGALHKFADKNGLDTRFVDLFTNFPSFKKEYGAYSAKAIKKLLPLMRRGSYWNEAGLDNGTRERIDKVIAGECGGNLSRIIREKKLHLTDLSSFKGLSQWLACYVVYDRHSEAKRISKWNEPGDIDCFLNSFRQHSMHNPIVEQVVTETLRVVRDIWKRTGRLDEIHVELGRDMKNPAGVRKKLSEQMTKNENTNLRIKTLLAEFINPEYEIENVCPLSPNQQNLLRIYEDGVYSGAEVIPEDITEILAKLNHRKQPTRAEFIRYKLWLEQGYRSPYTGEVIPLGKLFTRDYEIEHVIPQSRYFDDSYSNKVICESEVNKLKDNQLGFEFIRNHHGERVQLSFGRKPVKIFSVEAYKQFVKQYYSGSVKKMQKLLMDDIPDQFIARQMNDSRYISSFILGLLSNIVREKDENGAWEQEAISKNVLVCNGSITDRLKKDWGLDAVWNSLIYPRFERLNEMENGNRFGYWDEKDGKRFFRIEVPLELQRGFRKKRIDHRHHAMDAIVIACATRNHINYLNNESARKDAKISRYDLQRLLCEKQYTDSNRNYKRLIKKPWPEFTQEVKEVLEQIIPSFKQNLRIITKSVNHYAHFDERGKKVLLKQLVGDCRAIRKPMHKETYYGRVNLKRIKEVNLSVALDNPPVIVNPVLKSKVKLLVSYNYDKKRIERYFKENKGEWKALNPAKVAVYYFTDDTLKPMVATRKSLDHTFSEEKIKEKVTDTGIRKILLNHLAGYGGNPELAFSPDGIDEMNKNILELNDGQFHQPILRVRVSEKLGSKFPVGFTGNKTSKYVEAAQGTNLFFAVYRAQEHSRTYKTVPLNEVIERLKQGWSPVPELDERGNPLLFWLSPNDLVYVPTLEESESGRPAENLCRDRIYKFVSCTGDEAHFIPARIATPIVQTLELGSNNKAQRAWTGEMIKEICIPVKLDRLGTIAGLQIV